MSTDGEFTTSRPGNRFVAPHEPTIFTEQLNCDSITILPLVTPRYIFKVDSPVCVVRRVQTGSLGSVFQLSDACESRLCAIARINRAWTHRKKLNRWPGQLRISARDAFNSVLTDQQTRM